RVYYLGGQSNMDGYGYINDLPDSLNKLIEHAWIFHGNPMRDNSLPGGDGSWEQLGPGHGVGFSFSEGQNQLSNRFGVEVSFGYQMCRFFPGEKVAIIKYSLGGTSLDTLIESGGYWNPDYRGSNGLSQYDHFLATLSNAFTNCDIDGDGRNDILVPSGIVWMQGEADALYDRRAAKLYYGNLKRLMDLMRAALRNNDIPVAIGMISDSGMDADGKVWEHMRIVHKAQEKFAARDKNAGIVRTTLDYEYSDPYHYDSEGYIDLGKSFAKTIYYLDTNP
ncbi:MAG TPA: sialate O-acetylesterase, partial [Bacteroidales bacterium]|nr:sialate O-acetylesterase [Bacteroidales bacterium]